MSFIKLKAKWLVKTGKVKLEGTSDQFNHFLVKERYSVRIPKKGTNGRYNCTCKSGSCFRVGEICSHIKACELWLKGMDLE